MSTLFAVSAVILGLFCWKVLRVKIPVAGLQKPYSLKSAARRTLKFGLFDRWYAGITRQHAHVFILNKRISFENIQIAMKDILNKLQCLSVTIEGEQPDELQFVKNVAQLPIKLFNNQNWQKMMEKLLDTNLDTRKGDYLWSLSVVEDPSISDKMVLIFTFNHLVTDGQGALEIINIYLEQLLLNNNNTIVEHKFVPIGIPLENVVDVRPSFGYILSQLSKDIFGFNNFKSPYPMFTKDRLNERNFDLCTRIEYIEMKDISVKNLIAYCKKYSVTINAFISAALYLSYNTWIKSKQNCGSDEKIALEYSLSFRHHLHTLLDHKGCGGNYISNTRHVQSICQLENCKDIWTLAQSLMLEQKYKLKIDSMNPGLIGLISGSVSEWYVKKAATFPYYGRSRILSSSNLGKVDHFFHGKVRDCIEEAWFAQANSNKSGALFETSITTLSDTLRMTLSYCFPAFLDQDAKEYCQELKKVLEIVNDKRIDQYEI